MKSLRFNGDIDRSRLILHIWGSRQATVRLLRYHGVFSHGFARQFLIPKGFKAADIVFKDSSLAPAENNLDIVVKISRTPLSHSKSISSTATKSSSGGVAGPSNTFLGKSV
ncbi:hypothetical protein TWF481_002779 [Arthrobotrys musiformis]|uniref:Uncharacterized protein n=1 Tax=Arthrobotrys musiformis TaxID=47236 RepID=A0AAV9VR81_9PEZI